MSIHANPTEKFHAHHIFRPVSFVLLARYSHNSRHIQIQLLVNLVIGHVRRYQPNDNTHSQQSPAIRRSRMPAPNSTLQNQIYETKQNIIVVKTTHSFHDHIYDWKLMILCLSRFENSYFIRAAFYDLSQDRNIILG